MVSILNVVLAGAILTGGRPTDRAEGSELVGKPASEWTAREWIGSPPLSLAGLRGKVVLVRWFTDSECPFCHATAPALNSFHKEYAARGLAVIGMYHHKRPELLTLDAVRKTVREYGFTFPVGVDRDWRTLNRWWLDGKDGKKRDFTSVSFLIDRGGVIRHVHPGGSMEPGKPDTAAMQAQIERLLAEPAVK